MKDEKRKFAQWLIDNQDKRGTPDWDTVSAAFQKLDGGEEAEPALTPMPSGEAPSVGQIAGGLGAEVGIAMGGQAAGAALAPFTLGISYPVLAFSSGVAGSVAAQRLEGRESVSPGRALFAGLINLIPGSSAAKGGAKIATTIARGAGRGAAIGAGEATAVATVDEGRLPTLGEVGTYAGIGAGFGGALGGAMQGGRRVWDKVKTKTPAQVDAAIASGEIAPKDLLPTSNNPDANLALRSVEKAAEDVVIEAQEAPALAIAVAKPSTLLERFKSRAQAAKAAVAPSRVLGKEIQSVAIQSKQEALAAEELGSRVARRVDGFVKKQTDRVDAELKINAYLDGAIEALPPSYKGIQPELDLFREKMGDLQAKVVANIDAGRTNATPEVRDLIARSMDEGNYLTREFRWFTDKNYFPTQKQLDAVRAELGEGAEEVLASLNNKKLTAVENQNFLPTAIDGFLRKRKDLGPAMLEYLGEIKQPGERIRGSLSRVARGAYRDEGDAAIKQLLLERGIASRTSSPGAVEISLRRYEQGGSGVYAAPHVQKALDQIYTVSGKDAARAPVTAALSDLWNTGVGVSKAVKVLLNPPSYAVQLYGNTANLLGMGINPFVGAGRGLRLALSEYGPVERLSKNPESRIALLKDINDMGRYGIKGTNILDSDIRSSLERGIFSDTAQKIIDPVSKAYTTPDTMGRFVAWKHHQRLFRDMFPTANEETIKQFAADVTNDVYQNYSRLSRTGRDLSRIGIIPQFASFTMEFARNQYNQGRIIREMMAGTLGKNVKGLGQANMDAMRLAAGERLSALLGVYALTFASIKAFNANNNVDQETEAALKTVAIPSWDNNRFLAITYDPETKTGKYANPSYVVPNAVGLSALDAGLKGEPLEGVMDMLTNEFVGEGSFLFRSTAAALFNVDPKNRKKISTEVDRYKNTVDRVKFLVEDAFQPGFAREVRKFQEARRGQGELTTGDVARRQIGVRLNSFDVKESAMFSIKENVENSRLESSRYSSARDYSNKSQEEIAQIYQRANASHNANMQEIIKKVDSLRALKIPQDEIIEILGSEGARLGSAAILDTLRGTISDLPLVKRTTPTAIWDERIAPLGSREQEQEIRRIASTDPQLANSLVSILRSNRSAEARGITGIDRLYMGLGVADGTRAEYIYRQMQESPNPTALLNEFKRKGIVTPQVAEQIRQRQAASQGQPY
jgi:hypothetical protein